jgi:hypothetical protein
MAQLSLRLDDDLHRRATFAARVAGTSLNAYIAKVLRIATDPSSNEPEADRIRLRFFEAGLLPTAEAPTPHVRTPVEQAAFEAARARTAGGTPGSELIAEDRRSR